MRINWNKAAAWIVAVTVAVTGGWALYKREPMPLRQPVVVAPPPVVVPPPEPPAPVVAAPAPAPKVIQNRPKAKWAKPKKAKKHTAPKKPAPKSSKCAKVPAIAYKHPPDTVISYAERYGVKGAELDRLKQCIGAG